MKFSLFIASIIMTMSLISCKNKEITATSGDQSSATHDIRLSLAQWSFHKELDAKKMDHLQFAEKAASLGFEGVEYVNKFFKDKAQDTAYLNKMTEKANAAGVTQLLIMIDDEGYLADRDQAKRDEAINNHHKWVDAAAFLGCHSIRVNAHGEGTAEEVATAAVDGLSRLGDYAAQKNINVIVENHGGYSSNGEWLANVMKTVNKPNVGTLPDFGNFCLKRQDNQMWGTPCMEEYDRYKGVEELLPYAKAVSAKSYDFNAEGSETLMDYPRLMTLVKNSGYKGFVGVEYEGERLGEEQGIIATRDLLRKCLSALYPAESRK